MSSFRRRAKDRSDHARRSPLKSIRAKGTDGSPLANGRSAPEQARAEPESYRPALGWGFCLIAALLLASFLWSYWPALAELPATWQSEPDYSHGFLVVPVALWFLWIRRGAFPGLRRAWAWSGLALVALAALIRLAGAFLYVNAVQVWSLPLWLAGVCWFFGGWRLVRWASPALLFLFFMIPLPFSAERVVSVPLQGVATRLSCWVLQSIGEPAFAEGNVILIASDPEPVRLEIARACSGLRIFVSIAALAFAYVVVIDKPWWTKLAVVGSVPLVALATNALRIVITGILHTHVSGDAAHRFSHDAAGWAMIPMAAALMAFVVWYMGRLIFEVKVMSAGELLSTGFNASVPEPRNR